jgi:hypothetical protein
MDTDHSEPSATQPGFWTRQLGLIATPRQARFDMFVGVMLPTPLIVLLISQAGNLRIFPSLCFGLCILTLAVWLLVGSRLSQGHGFFIGVLWIGALLNLLIALFIIIIFLILPLKNPLSMVGILPIVMIPLILGLIYWRNGWHALQRMRALQPKPERSLVVGTIILGLVAVLVLPLALQWQALQFVDRNVQLIIHSDPQQGVRSLRQAFWCDHSCYGAIEWEYQESTDPTRRAMLADAYRELTGLSIEAEINRYD